MNRRNFFKAAGAVMVGGLVGEQVQASAEPVVRYVQFNPPRETPAIWWMGGHVSTERFVSMHEGIGVVIAPEKVRHGWATRKLESIGMYLSDAPQENFEPITYWIPADDHALRMVCEAEDRALRLERLRQDHEAQLEKARCIDAMRLEQMEEAVARGLADVFGSYG